MTSDIRDCVRSMVAGMRGEKRAGLEKQAKNLVRLLARVGPSLAGATARDLRFLNRRGFTGFTPQRVQALRLRGMLPSTARELEGFNRGTENMLRWTPRPSTPEPVQPGFPAINYDAAAFKAQLAKYYAYPFEHMRWKDNNFFAQPAKITRTNAPNTRNSVDLRSREVTIPDAYAPGSFAEREMRAATSRHEAREWVRGNAAYAKGRDIALPGPSSLLFNSKQVGSTHAPGVIYDERVFRTQLANRLGIDTPWDKMPLSGGMYRGSRDAYTGARPLGYEFKAIRDWRRLNANQAAIARPMVDGFKANLKNNPELQAAIAERAGNVAAVLGMEAGRDIPESLVRRYFIHRLLRQRPQASDAFHEFTNIIDTPTRPYFGVQRSVPTDAYFHLKDFGDDLVKQYYEPISRMSGIPLDRLNGVLRGEDVVARPGSELFKLQQLSPYAVANKAQQGG